MNRPYAESCDQNRDPILTVIQPLLQQCQNVLEIGSGTGQHAIYFGAQMPHLRWHTSDRLEYHPGILAWLTEAALPNVLPPIELDVQQSRWPTRAIDVIFSANTTHIMHGSDVEALFAGAGKLLPSGGLLLLYGPFSNAGQHNSDSNLRFDQFLRARDPLSGIRDIDDLNRLATQAGLTFCHDYEMPVNNRILHWQKV